MNLKVSFRAVSTFLLLIFISSVSLGARSYSASQEDSLKQRYIILLQKIFPETDPSSLNANFATLQTKVAANLSETWIITNRIDQVTWNVEVSIDPTQLQKQKTKAFIGMLLDKKFVQFFYSGSFNTPSGVQTYPVLLMRATALNLIRLAGSGFVYNISFPSRTVSEERLAEIKPYIFSSESMPLLCKDLLKKNR